MYDKEQVKTLGKYLQRKFILGEVEGYEVVVALIAMEQDDIIKEEDIKPLLMVIHSNNTEGVIRSLKRAHGLIDEEMINSIVKEVSSQK